MSTKNTPGPWKADDTAPLIQPASVSCCRVHGEHGEAIAFANIWVDDAAEGRANAKLIAAAPALADALANAVAEQHHDFPANEDVGAPAQTVCGACGGTSPCSDRQCWVPAATAALRAAGRLP